MKAKNKYLELYCDSTEASKLPFEPVQHGVLIPCYGERNEILKQLESWKNFSESFLVILIINEAKNSENWAVESNRSLLATLKDFLIGPSEVDFFANYHGVKLKILDRTQDRSIANGVGEARKIGADFLLKLHSRGDLISEFIYSTDADVTPPPDFFSISSQFEKSLVALHFNFSHWCNEFVSVIEDYEFSLRYFAWGLRTAGSPYGYPSIGSCLVLNLNAYVKVRGFPQRKAGEDFYLMNKLRKIGGIRFLAENYLKIEARSQVRTPFGTSAALQRSSGEFLFYSPRVFKSLRIFLSKAEAALVTGSSFKNLKGLWPSEAGHPDLEGFWENLLHSSPHPINRLLQFHTWFDGFKTLRFIQALTRNTHPKERLASGLREDVLKSLKSQNFLNSSLELSLLDYSRNRVDHLSHGRSFGSTRVYP